MVRIGYKRGRTINGARRIPQFRLVAIAFALCALILCGGTRAEALSDVEYKVAEITNQIVRKEIDLERYYLNYKMVGHKDPRWRRARYFLLQQAGTAAGAAATTIPIVETGRNLKHPTNVRRGPLIKSYRVGIVGSCLGGGSSAMEFGSNCYTAVKNKVQHKDPGSVKNEVKRRLAEIDQLSAQRETLIHQLPDDNLLAVCHAEGRVLKLFRDWCVYEFADVYADVKAYQASNSLYYLMDVTANTLVGTAYLCSIRSFTRIQAAKPAVICSLVADSFYIASAPVSAKAYTVLYNRAYKKIGADLHEKIYDPEPEAKIQLAQLQSLLQNSSIEQVGPFGAHSRAELLAVWSQRYDEYYKEGEEGLRHLSKVALQNNIQGPLISLSYLGGDIVSTNATYNLAAEHPRGSNSSYFAASISSTAGSAVSFALTTQSLISEKRFEKHLRENGRLPEQIITKRLETLSDLDKLLANTGRGGTQ